MTGTVMCLMGTDICTTAELMAVMMTLSSVAGLQVYMLICNILVNPSESLSTVPATLADYAGNIDPLSLTVTQPVLEPVQPTPPKVTIPHSDAVDPSSSSIISSLDGGLPDASQTGVSEDRATQPSFSQAEEITLEPMLATDALQAAQSHASLDQSQLPEGVGGRIVEPHPAASASDSVVEATVSEDQFTTFDKWSEQYLAEQEKQKMATEEPPVAAKTSQKKLRQNFAASGCGAKVVASNTEAEHTSYLLNGNPDEYMISPCKAKKWFVVELCEPVQIHKVELGTLELFSSQPKSFKMAASERYPTKEWHPLGTYELSAERTVQHFPTVVSDKLVLGDYVKFVRVDMLEHYGQEHYCPITTFRVLGLDMGSDDEDETDQEQTESEGQNGGVSADGDEIEESVNLFTSAKDTVVKLVKKVLYKGDAEDSDGKKGTVDSSENGTVKTDEKVVVDKEAVKEKEVPCLDKISGSASESEKASTAVPEKVLISQSGPVESSKESEEKPIVTKLDATEQLPAETSSVPVVIKLARQEGDAASTEKRHAPYECESPLEKYLRLMSATHTTMCSKAGSESMCQCLKAKGKASRLSKLPSATSVVPTQQKVTDEATTQPIVMSEQTTTDPEVNKVTQESSEATTAQKPASVDSSQKSSNIPSNQDDPTPVVVVAAAKSDNSGSSPQANKLQDQQERPTHQSGPQQHELSSSQTTTFKLTDVSSTSSESLEPSTLTSDAKLDRGPPSAGTPGLGGKQSHIVEQVTSQEIFLKVNPSPTVQLVDSKEGFEMPVPETPSSEKQPKAQVVKESHGQTKEKPPGPDQSPESAEKAPVIPDPSPSNSGSQTQAQQNGQQVPVDVQKSQGQGSGIQAANGSGKKGVDLVKVGMANAKRDTSILKLSNRIVAVEQNVSMTKRYLEQLSQAFKQQNEEMMKLLNKTVSKLNTHLAQSDEKEVKQKAVVSTLEEKVVNLTKVVDALQGQVDLMGKELNQRQWLITVFQVLLFLWLLISSYRGRSKPALSLADHQFLLDTMPSQPQLDPQRRNSDVGVSMGLVDPVPLKRQKSETNLVPWAGSALNDTERASFLMASVSQGSKKKKKKKLKHVSSADGIAPQAEGIVSFTQPEPIQTPSFSSTAGVLFGLGPKEKESLEPGSNKENQFEHSHGRQWMGPEQKGESKYMTTGFVPAPTSGLCTELGTQEGNIQDVSAPEDTGSPQMSLEGSHLPSTPPSQKSWEDFKKDSPEFQLATYHRNKPRKLSDNVSNNTYCGERDKSHRPSLDSFYQNPTSTTEVLSPGWFFLSESYLSENRFKFPGTPVKDTSEKQHIPSATPPSPPPAPPPPPPPLPAVLPLNGHAIETQLYPRTLLPSSIKYSQASLGPEACRVVFSPASVTSLEHLSSGHCLDKQATLTPSFILISPDHAPTSFTSQQLAVRPHPPVRPRAPSVSAGPPPPTIPKDRTATQNPSSSTEPSSFTKPESVSAPVSTTDSCLTKDLPGSSKSKKISGAPPQPRHKRQGSLPLEVPAKNKSAEKDVVGRPKQGPVGPKSSGKLIGSKQRKSTPVHSSDIVSRSSQHKVVDSRKPPMTTVK